MKIKLKNNKKMYEDKKIKGKNENKRTLILKTIKFRMNNLVDFFVFCSNVQFF